MNRIIQKVVMAFTAAIAFLLIFVRDPGAQTYPVLELYIMTIVSAIVLSTLDMGMRLIFPKVGEKNHDQIVCAICGFFYVTMFYPWYKIWFCASIPIGITLIVITLVTLFIVTRESFAAYKRSTWREYMESERISRERQEKVDQLVNKSSD